MFIMFVLEVPKTTPRFSDSPEKLTGLSISSYLQLTFNTKKKYKTKSAKEKGTWGKVGSLV